MSYGQNSNLGIIFQNSFGTVGDTGSIHFLPMLSETIARKIPTLRSATMRGIIDAGDAYRGPEMNEGEIEVEAQPVPLGALLKSVLELTSSVQSGGIYTHTFKPRTSDWDELSAIQPTTIYKYMETGSAMLYGDMNGTTLEMSVANGEFLKAKVGYVGGIFSQIASVAASYPAGKKYTWDQSSVSIGGSAVSEIEQLTITLEENREAMHTLNNTRNPSRIKHSDFRMLNVEGTIKFDNQTQFQNFLNQSENELIIHFVNSLTEIQSGYNESITLQIPLMRFEEFEPTASGPGQISVGFTANGIYSVDSATCMQITLVNTQATY